MKGILSLIFGILALLSGILTLSSHSPAFAVLTMPFWLLGASLGNRAWNPPNKQKTGLVGFVLAMIGWVASMIYVFMTFVF